MTSDSEPDDIARLRQPGPAGLVDVFSECRDRLERMVEFRLEPALRGRIDPVDVLQEAFIEISRRLPDYLARPSVSFYVWARQITLQTLIDLQRRHFGQKRDAHQEARGRARTGDDASRPLVDALSAQWTSPSGAAMRAEEIARLHAALDSMEPVDREVLALRHFEQLGNGQVAEVLGLSVTAASNRYVRAMSRLGEVLRAMTGDEAGSGS